jgi:hypothetical protein
MPPGRSSAILQAATTLTVNPVLGRRDGAVGGEHGFCVLVLLDSCGQQGATGVEGVPDAGELDDGLAAVGGLLVALLRRAEHHRNQHFVEAQAQLRAQLLALLRQRDPVQAQRPRRLRADVVCEDVRLRRDRTLLLVAPDRNDLVSYWELGEGYLLIPIGVNLEHADLVRVTIMRHGFNVLDE